MLALARTVPERWPRLHDMERVPPALREALRAHGLLGAGIPRDYGGLGGDARLIGAGARALAAGSGSAGLALTWLGHHAIAHFLIAGLGSPVQKARILPRAAAGALGLAVAISEPEAGAHPKHLRTRFVPTPGGGRLEGEKAWVTNGPSADVFIVLAIDRVVEGRKHYSAWLVPRDRPGLERTPGVAVPFLRPAGHCGLSLRGVPVTPEDRLGPEGEAFPRLALPLRSIEDALGLSARTGLVEHALTALAAGRERPGSPGPGADPEALGELAARVALLGAAAREAAELVREGPGPGLEPLLEGGRIAAESILGVLRRLPGLPAGRAHACGPDGRLRALLRDLEGLAGVAARARAARRARIGHRIRAHAERAQRAGDESHGRT